MKFKSFVNNSLTESIITPENLKISTDDIDILNKKYNKKDIYFTQNNKNKAGSYGNYAPSGRIEIQVPKDADLDVLNSVVSHELLHREQNRKSNGNYGEWISKYGNGINDYVRKFNDRVDAETSIQKEYDKILKMQNIFKYGNSFEQMAYAYQFVKTRKNFGFTKPDDIVKFLKDTEIPVNNKIKKYIAGYWLIKDTL